MNDRLRIVLGIILLFLFYQSLQPNNPIIPPIPDKIVKPDQDIIDIVSTLDTSPSEEDTNKLAGVFYALSQDFAKRDIKYPLQVQYLLDYVGKNSVGTELMNNGLPKYPLFAPSAAAILVKVIGPQDSTNPITQEQKERLAKVFYGFAWKLYTKNKDAVFEEYKERAKKAINQYFNEKPDDDPVNDKCQCNGLGYIIHGDGHRTKCPCIESGQKCPHNPKCGSITGDFKLNE